MRVFMVHLGPLGPQWTMVLWVVAALTMTVAPFILLATYLFRNVARRRYRQIVPGLSRRFR